MTATFKAVEGLDGKAEWVLPIVDARKGLFRGSKGRMARGDAMGSSYEKVAVDPYAV